MTTTAETERRPAVIVDLDGTLASCGWRRHFTEQRPADWRSFNAGIPFDTPVPWVLATVHLVRALGWEVILTTGRRRTEQVRTWEWLQKHQVPYDLLLMRNGKDLRPDSTVKTELYIQHIRDRFDVRFVIDDRPAVCAAWRALGLVVLQVEDPGLPPRIGGTEDVGEGDASGGPDSVVVETHDADSGVRGCGGGRSGEGPVCAT